MAFGPINKYNQNIKVAKRKKEELDLLIKKYNLKYTISFEIKKVHGSDEIKTDLKFNGIK